MRGGGDIDRNGACSVNAMSALASTMKPIAKLNKRPGARVA